MHRIYIAISVISLILISGALFAQESADSLHLDSTDSSTINLTATGIDEQYDFFSDFFRILYAILFFIVAFIFSIYLRQPFQRLAENRRRYSRIIKQIVPLLLVIWWFFVIYIITMQILDVTHISSLSLIIIIGLALALAFQDILKDIIAGLMVPFENHIEKGNKILFGTVFGEIIKTGFRETRIKKSDGSVVIVPNSHLLKKTVVSVSTEPENCPVSVDFFIPLNSNLDKCREIAHKSAIVSPYLFLDKPVTVHFSNVLANDQSLIKMRVEASLRKLEFQFLFTSELTEGVLKEITHATDI